MTRTTARETSRNRTPLRVAAIVAGLTLAMSFVEPAASASPIGSESVVSRMTIAGDADDDGSSIFISGHSELKITRAPGPELTAPELSGLTASIICALNVEHVHPSAHVAGTINGVATIKCNALAGSLTVHYSLIRVTPNNTQWGAGSLSNAGESSIQNNRSVPCSEGPGEFQGWAQGEISPPPGYELEGPAIHSDYGASLGVACGSNLTAGESSSQIAESVTVTFIRSDLAG